MALTRLILKNKSFILLLFIIYILFWLINNTSKQSKGINKISSLNRLKYRWNSTFHVILNHLFRLKLNLILIDPPVLEYLFIRQLSFDHLQKQLITFAITDESVESVFDSIQDIQFSIKVSKTILSNGKTSIGHIFIEYQDKIVHLAVLHKYHSFYLIYKNTLPLSDNTQLSYGDKLRAVEDTENELHEYLFSYPRNVLNFVWLYNTSEFIHCNRTLADKMKNEFHLYENTSQLDVGVLPIRYVAYGLDNLEKRYWLAGGTLLGWYRHCGLIPFTQDADFGLYAEEYDESIRTYFLGNPVTYIWAALGLVNDSLEFRLSSGQFTLDLFWAYRDGDHRWCGYHTERLKFRRTVPLLPTLCSCDLFGYRFSVPCSPVDYLDGEYGKDKWKTPVEKNFTWINMKYHSVWNDISWMYAVRLYTPEGTLRTDKSAIECISKHFNYSLTSIPSFRNVIPDEPVTLPPLKTKLVYGSLIKKKNARKKVE